MQNLSMLSSSVVFLLRQNLATFELKKEELERFLTPELTSAQTADGRFVITSIADQMEVIIGVNRIDVRDRSPQGPRAKKVSQVAQGILQALNGDIRAYGINYEFETDTPNGTSGAFLLKAFIREDTKNYIKNLKGAALTLFFNMGDRQARIVIEPRRRRPEADKIFVSVNVHTDLGESESAPVEEKLTTEIETYFEKVKEILSKVIK
jgi:hypothetical protein